MTRVILSIALLMASAFCLEGCHDKKPTQPSPEDPPKGPIAVGAAWSPDGSRIAYYLSGHPLEDTGSRIQILELSTGDITTIDSTLYGTDHIDWSPDGQWIAFDDNGRIVKMKTNGDSLVELTQGPRHFRPNWSPDGSLLVFYVPYGSAPLGIHTVTADGSIITPLGIYGLDADWLGNTDSIVAVFHLGLQDTSCYGLGVCSPGDTAAFAVSDCRSIFVEECTSSFDAASLAFVDLDQWNTLAIFLIERPGTSATRISERWCIQPAWSPDGSKIVYSSLMDGALHVYDLRTKTTTRVTPVIRPVSP